MKIKKTRLEKIINEELGRYLKNEDTFQDVSVLVDNLHDALTKVIIEYAKNNRLDEDMIVLCVKNVADELYDVAEYVVDFAEQAQRDKEGASKMNDLSLKKTKGALGLHEGDKNE